MATYLKKSFFLRCLKSLKRQEFGRLYSQTKISDLIVTSKQKKVFLVGINRPDKRNCINDDAAEQLRNAFETFENDDDAYVAVLYGKGGNFCAGYDLEHVAQGNFYGIQSEHGPMGPTKKFLKKPVIASVNGYAVAGGFELALWCDLRVVEETAVLGFFNRRFGIPLVNGSTVRLPQLIGLSRAIDLILTGRGITGQEALEMGIATRTVACGTALGNAINLANSLCKFPQECLRVDRLSAYESTYNAPSLDHALKFECQNAASVLTKESVKGALAFMKGVGRHGRFQLDATEEKEETQNVEESARN